MSKLALGAEMAVALAKNPRHAAAPFSWPVLSVTSFKMVFGLTRQGILPGTVLDVGANTGQFAVACAKLFPNVWVCSFEPVPECFEELRENISSLGNVVAYPLALGESEGELSFHVNVYSHSSSALPLAEAHKEVFPEAQETRTTTVKVSTLDRVFVGAELPRPVLLKLDVQGYEAQVIRGGAETLKRVDYVVLEASFKPMYEGELLFMDIVRLMEEHGFRFERPVGWLEAPGSGEVLQMDALFARKDEDCASNHASGCSG